jgi:hypothetical protein
MRYQPPAALHQEPPWTYPSIDHVQDHLERTQTVDRSFGLVQLPVAVLPLVPAASSHP